MPIVDGLETIQVQIEQRHLALASPGQCQRLIQHLVERTPIGHPGEAVVLGFEGKPLEQFGTLVEIAAQIDEQQGLSLIHI